MSQPPSPPKEFDADQTNSATLADYHALMAAGHFKPSTFVNLPVSRTNPPTPALPAAAATLKVPSRAPTASPTTTSSPYATAPSTPRIVPSAYPPTPRSRPVYGPFPGHMPQLASHQPSPPTTDSITRDIITARIQGLLQSKLSTWSIANIVLLSSSLTDLVISLGVRGHLGSYGLASAKDIFMVIGHEGTRRYMALSVTAPIALRELLRGTSCDLSGDDPLKNVEAMECVRQAFHNCAVDEWQRVHDILFRSGGR